MILEYSTVIFNGELCRSNYCLFVLAAADKKWDYISTEYGT